MITARLRIPRPDGLVEETVLELPEGGKLDGFDLLDSFIARFGETSVAPLNGAPAGDAGQGEAAARQQVGRYPENQPGAANSAAPKQGMPTGVRDASLEAYHDLVASGRMSRQHRALVAFFRAHPGRDWTRAELAEGMGWRINVICGRVNELLTPPFDVLEEVGRRRCKFTGESANALRLK